MTRRSTGTTESCATGRSSCADPTELPWLYRAAVLRGTRQGLATELAAGLLGWARQRGAVRCLGSTAPDNGASQAVLARLGFVRTGEQIDDEDGLELVCMLELGTPAAVR